MMKKGTSYYNESSKTRNGLLGKGFHNHIHLTLIFLLIILKKNPVKLPQLNAPDLDFII
jgi:hypothetical protein